MELSKPIAVQNQGLMTLTLAFQGQMLKKLYYRRRANWHWTKGMWINRKRDTFHGFELWLLPWPWPWFFKVKLGGSTNIERKRCELIGSWTHYVTLTLDFQGQILKKPYPRNGRTYRHGTKGVWINRKSGPLCDWILTSPITLTLDLKDRMLNPLCDLELWPWP